MNIFYVDHDPYQAAQDLCDAHVCKMTIETAQMLSTAHRVLDEHLDHHQLYKLSHKNHPSNIWVREHPKHYIWLFKHFHGLCLEFTKRFQKIHLTQKKLPVPLNQLPETFDENDDVWYEPPPAMPDHCKKETSIESYRNYYRTEKASFATWRYTQPPTWYL